MSGPAHRVVQDVPEAEWHLPDFPLGSKPFWNKPWTLNQQVWLAYLWNAVTEEELPKEIAAEVLGRNVGALKSQALDLKHLGNFEDRLDKARARGLAWQMMVEDRVKKAGDFLFGGDDKHRGARTALHFSGRHRSASAGLTRRNDKIARDAVRGEDYGPQEGE
ncbi:hypothetical protein VTI74DRAFT_1554 [Chaetomium olivicolor]